MAYVDTRDEKSTLVRFHEPVGAQEMLKEVEAKTVKVGETVIEGDLLPGSPKHYARKLIAFKSKRTKSTGTLKCSLESRTRPRPGDVVTEDKHRMYRFEISP